VRRKYFCEEELRLNRRLAPTIYMEVVTIGGSLAAPKVGVEPAIEYAVKMRQFPEAATLDNQLQAGTVTATGIRELAEGIASFHQSAPVANAGQQFGNPATISAPVLATFRQLTECLQDSSNLAKLGKLSAWNRAQLKTMMPVLIGRKTHGRIRECHGDLHLANLVQLNNRIIPFDCLEFDPELRWIDVMSEVAFLAMDLMLRNHTELAFEFLNRYLECTGDYKGLQVLRFYLVYRCLVRAKVAALVRQQGVRGCRGDSDLVARHLSLAVSIITPPGQTRLLITHGFSGSGKTWLTDHLKSRMPAIRLRSDLERRRLHGLSGSADSHSGVAGGIYREANSADTYRHLLAMAAISLSAGFDTIVDASFLQRRYRRMFRDLARGLEVQFTILDCQAPFAVLQQRIKNRLVRGNDASEANLAVLDQQLATADPLDSNDEKGLVSINVGGSIDWDVIARQIQTA